jgi:phosphopantothenoylcysteine decarboxylase/phosphopantothenate--cysteine ligase
MARILLGVSGGIAAYKALEFIRLATAAGHAVRVVQTRTAQRFVGAASFAALSGAPVLVSEFDRDPARGAFPGEQAPAHDPLSHLELAARADLYLIAPASANTIAKLAGGLADNLLCSCALAAPCPVLLAPAMNDRMYEHAATRTNLQRLRERGVRIIEPGAGRLASVGEEGIGRLAEPAQLLAECEAALAAPAQASTESGSARSGWESLKVLVTAGGTREPIDSVRYIGNSSSGRMGFALARAAHARGAQVTLIAANVALDAPAGVATQHVRTAAELARACEREFGSCDVLLMAAAVADFRPAQPSEGKIAKGEHARLVLELERTGDVLGALASRRSDGQTLVGFAAEHGTTAIERGGRKLIAKRLDAVVVNDISRSDVGFDSEENEVSILIARDGAGQRGALGGEPAPGADAAEIVSVPRAPKAVVAEAILDAVERIRAPDGR